MAPLPKRKLSKGRRGRRRNSYSTVKTVAHAAIVCENCKTLKLPHRACGNCGKK